MRFYRYGLPVCNNNQSILNDDNDHVCPHTFLHSTNQYQCIPLQQLPRTLFRKFYDIMRFEPDSQILQHKLLAFAQDSDKLSDTCDRKNTKRQDLGNVSNYSRIGNSKSGLQIMNI